MENNKECKKCCRCVDGLTDLFTVCEGDCAGLFHAKCVGLKEDDIDFLTRTLNSIILLVNTIWMCDVCMDKFRKKRDGIWHEPAIDTTDATTIEDDVRELKSTVTGILDSLSKIMKTTTSTDGAKLVHSTPNSSYSPSDGPIGCVSNEECVQRLRDTTDCDTFSLFLSNIDPCVTEWDIHRMVSRALGAHESERWDVIKLTKYWSSMRTLDFISFKVTMNVKWKNRALDRSTWPVNIRFREFVNRHNDTWRPIC